ncbi:MAG TPA: hypothetical protein VNR70_12825 [Steroidobacteraceae bacterium]|nr:hypothetical protein [Steroidobacteraceae bacterium]
MHAHAFRNAHASGSTFRGVPCLALALWLVSGLLLLPSRGDANQPDGNAEHALRSSAKPRVGRIFFSPGERRSRHAVAPRETPAAHEPSPAAAADRRVVNGAVSSSTRGRAVWINGATVENSAMNKSVWTDRNGNVWLRDDKQGTRMMRPGESIDRNGTIEDLLRPGSVTRR